MKRCPECRRDYYDDSLLYCLEDGAALVQGSVATQDELPSEAPTRQQIHTTDQTVALPSRDVGVAKVRRLDRRLLLVPIALAVIALAGFVGYRYFNSTVAAQITSIAVMPFVNDSGNADIEYLSDGMTETLIGSLSQLPNLNVKPRSSVFRYKGKDMTLQAIGKELNVQAILTGRVVQRAEQLTLSLELVDVQQDKVIWSEQYNRKQADLVSLQTEIARDVSGKLNAKLSGSDAAKVEKSYTSSPEAYQLYLKGRFSWNKRTTESLVQAADFYNQAIAKDPGYALAYSGLGETYLLFSTYGVASSKDSMPKAKAAAERGLELEPSLAAPHATIGYYLAEYEWDRVGSEREFRRAIEMDPNYATTHQWFATHVLVPAKRFDEALTEIRRAEELDPLSPVIGTNLGDTLVFARRYDEALTQFKRVVSLDPNFPYSHLDLGNVYGLKGMYPEAIAEARKAVELNGGQRARAFLGLWLASSGGRDEAMKLLDQMKQESSKGFVPGYAIAIVCNGLNEKEEALNWLEKDVSERSSLIHDIGVAPEFDNLRPEPRFKDLLKRLNLPE